MSPNTSPLPVNEMDRILNLYEFDIDYSNLKHTFKDLTQLAAKIAGTDISLINLIDSYTQWSVANFGLSVDQMPREDSVCQYTILAQDHFEVEDLSVDVRFQHKFYVKDPLNLKYYCGVPLKTTAGHHIGALCVLDKNQKKLSEEKIELLKIIANEIIAKLNSIKVVKVLENEITISEEMNKRVSHDIRGPIAGIIGISDLILEDSKETETLALATMISKSGYAVLDLADEILSPPKLAQLSKIDFFDLSIFKQKVEKLFSPQAKAKNISFTVNLSINPAAATFKKDKLLQIVGNLISNAIKFTPKNGFVSVTLQTEIIDGQNTLAIGVTDSGVGLDKQTIASILEGNKKTSAGTSGELGYGFGLVIVKDLVQSIGGKMTITSDLENGATFEVLLPI